RSAPGNAASNRSWFITDLPRVVRALYYKKLFTSMESRAIGWVPLRRVLYGDSQTCLSFPSTWPHAKLQNPKYSLFSSQPMWRNVRIAISDLVEAQGGTPRLVISKMI